jgi:hypothetical protein
MKQKVVSAHTDTELNGRLDELRINYNVEIVLLSTCPAPEKYARYDTTITVVVKLTGK